MKVVTVLHNLSLLVDKKMSQYYKTFMRTFKGNKRPVGCAICDESFETLRELKDHKYHKHSY